MTHYATEGGSHHAAWAGTFRNTGRPQIYIVHGGIEARVSLESFVSEHSVEVIPRAGTLKATEFAPSVVRRDAMIAAALNVQRGQIGTKSAGVFLEEVVSQLKILGNRS